MNEWVDTSWKGNRCQIRKTHVQRSGSTHLQTWDNNITMFPLLRAWYEYVRLSANFLVCIAKVPQSFSRYKYPIPCMSRKCQNVTQAHWAVWAIIPAEQHVHVLGWAGIHQVRVVSLLYFILKLPFCWNYVLDVVQTFLKNMVTLFVLPKRSDLITLTQGSPPSQVCRGDELHDFVLSSSETEKSGRKDVRG